jgi:hypothetical protein
LNGIDAWLHEVPFVKDKYPHTFHRLNDEPNNLGWRQISQGRMTTKWSRLQDQHLTQIQYNTNLHSGILWTTNIITAVCKDFFKMWTSRNTAIHGNDSESRQKSRLRHAVVAIWHLHTKHKDLLAADQELCIGDNDQDIETWVQT